MPKELPVKSADLSLLSVSALWPMAMAAAMLEESTELLREEPRVRRGGDQNS